MKRLHELAIFLEASKGRRSSENPGECTSSSGSPAPPARRTRLGCSRRSRRPTARSASARPAPGSRCWRPSCSAIRRCRATRRSRGSSSTPTAPPASTTRATGARPYASGSAKVDAYVICPCSMGTVGTIASGAMPNLIQRAASVALKEERRLVLMPRETPLSAIHLRNMLTLREAGATILFLAPGFYHGAETVENLVDFIVARALDLLGLDHALTPRGDRHDRRVRPAAGRRRAADVRPDRPGLRRDEPRHDRRARPALAQGDGPRRGARGGPRPRRLLRHRRPRGRRAEGGRGPRGRPRLLRADARARPAQGAGARVGAGRRARAPVRGRELRLGGRRLRGPERRRSRSSAQRAAPRAPSRRPARDPRDHDPARLARAVLPRLVRPDRAAARPRAARRRRVHVPARERAPLPGARGPRGAARRVRLPRRAIPALRRRYRRPARRGGGRSGHDAGGHPRRCRGSTTISTRSRSGSREPSPRIPGSSPRSGTRRSPPAGSGCGPHSSSCPHRREKSRRSRPASRSSSSTWRRSSTTT